MNPNEFLARVEAAGLWSYFHKDWLIQMRMGLLGQLSDNYVVLVESEVVMINPKYLTGGLKSMHSGLSRTREPDAHEMRAFSATATTATLEVVEAYEVDTRYQLVVRRVTENVTVAVLELLSPSHKGIGNSLDREKHLRKREQYLDAGVSVLEIDVLLKGNRDLPGALRQLQGFQRVAWTAFHDRGNRRYRGWGWNDADALPNIEWQIDFTCSAVLKLEQSLQEAIEFNRWVEFLESL